jgi:hypothetical protein
MGLAVRLGIRDMEKHEASPVSLGARSTPSCGLNDSYPMTDVPVARSYLVRELFLSQ